MRPTGVVDGQQVNIPALRRAIKPRCVLLSRSPLQARVVPMQIGTEADLLPKCEAGGPRKAVGANGGSVLKLTQVGEASSLRRSR